MAVQSNALLRGIRAQCASTHILPVLKVTALYCVYYHTARNHEISSEMGESTCIVFDFIARRELLQCRKENKRFPILYIPTEAFPTLQVAHGRRLFDMWMTQYADKGYIRSRQHPLTLRTYEGCSIHELHLETLHLSSRYTAKALAYSIITRCVAHKVPEARQA